MYFSDHIEHKEYDPGIPNTPSIISIRGEQVGILKKSKIDDDILALFDAIYEKGLEHGKADRSSEIRELL